MTDNTQKINAKSVLKYMFLPGIIPRAKELGGSGFGYLAFLFASVYQAVRILPANHPYTQSKNIGTYTIRQVIAAAANNLEFNKKNIDQIIVFFALLAGLVLLALQFVLFIMMLFSGQAFAQATGEDPFKSIFVTEHPQTDIAFLMLDYTFGIPEFFGSNAMADGPTPFHEGMHALFQFYNLAILLVGVLIFLYYVIVVVIETAQTGVPFGRRFEKIYAPLRLIAAVGLLVPLPTPSGGGDGSAAGGGGSSGAHFNAAQYIVLYASKLGSSMATNGWILYNRNLHNPIGADNASLVARAKAPDLNGLLHFVSVYHACRTMYNLHATKEYISSGGTGSPETIQIEPYVIVNNTAEPLRSYTYDKAKKQYKNSNVEIVLGEKDARHDTYAGNVFPYCGRMTISLSNDNPSFYTGNGQARRGRSTEKKGGVNTVEMEYYNLVTQLLKADSVNTNQPGSDNYNPNNPTLPVQDNQGCPDRQLAALGVRAAYVHIPSKEQQNPCKCSGVLKDGPTCGKGVWFPPIANLEDEINRYKSNIDLAIKIAYEDLQENMDLKLTEEMEKRGWGGAGIWYNNIAQVNGSLTAAIYSLPEVREYPVVFSHVINEKSAQNTANGSSCATFEPNLSDGRSVDSRTDADELILRAMNDVYKYWSCETAQLKEGELAGLTGNVVIDAITTIFGLNGLFAMKANSEADEATGMPKVHPMASLSAVGKSLVENAIRSIGTSIVFTAFGGLTSGLSQAMGAGLQTLSGMFVSIATIGLTAGFVLYYILPFLPFLYFFFAVGSWVKSIFEAMVGAPLWALAHLKIDGEGFSGRSASHGYFLILEIFIRPIITLFGLIGGMAVFAAMVTILNSVFDLVVLNITGDTGYDGSESVYDSVLEEFQRGVLDQFFFTIMYAILVYMMATSCFKMIDSIPKMVMHWIGSGVSTFNDNTSDPTQNLTSYTSLAGSQFIGPIVGGINKGVGGVAGLAGQLITPPKPPAGGGTPPP